MKLFVNNLPPSTRAEELQALFSRFGAVTRVTLLKTAPELEGCGVLELSGSILSAKKIAAQINRSGWRNRQLDIYEPALFIERARNHAASRTALCTAA